MIVSKLENIQYETLFINIIKLFAQNTLLNKK